jgi:DNA-binding NtrC family response regulator
VQLHLLPLRDRKEDILHLFEHFMRTRLPAGAPLPRLSMRGIELMMQYDWPGNAREVRNLVDRLLIDLSSEDIPDDRLPGAPNDETLGSPSGEKERLLTALIATRWNKRKAAESLHWSRMTLYRKLAKYGLSQWRNDAWVK